MKRLHASDEFFRIRGLRERMRAWEELWRLLAGGPHRLASREGDEFRGGPACRGDAPPQVGDRLVGHVDPEGTDFGFGSGR